MGERWHWLFTWACGCGFSVMTEDVATTETEAWRETFDTRAEEHAYRDAGVTCKRITHTQWETEHLPKFREPCGCGSPRPPKRQAKDPRPREHFIDLPVLPRELWEEGQRGYRDAFDYYGPTNIKALPLAIEAAMRVAWEAGYRQGWDAGDDGVVDLAIENAVEAKLEAVWEKAHDAVGELAVTLAPVLRAVHPFDLREDTSRVVEEVLKAADR